LQEPIETYSSRNPVVRHYFWSRLTRMVEQSRAYRAKVILDLGCGKGELLQMLERRLPPSDCIGVDAGGRIYEARKRIGRGPGSPRFHLVRADIRRLPLRPRCAQLVFCVSVLEHLTDPGSAIREVAVILENGGVLMVGLPTENLCYRIARKLVGFTKPRDHYHSGAHVQSLLRQHFTLERIRTLPLAVLPDAFALYIVLTSVKSSLTANSAHTDPVRNTVSAVSGSYMKTGSDCA
jgi:SAM-dependent methyltransferase